MSENIKFVQGNEACIEGALYAGLDFYAGYPITPSTQMGEYWAEATAAGHINVSERPLIFIEPEGEHAAGVEQLLGLLELIERHHSEQEQDDDGDLSSRVGLFAGGRHAVGACHQRLQNPGKKRAKSVKNSRRPSSIASEKNSLRWACVVPIFTRDQDFRT